VNPILPERYTYAADPLLGEGGMGQVYRAHDLQLDVPVAVKVVRPELGRDLLFRQLFEREVRAAARLAHPSIVPIHDTGELSNGSPYLALALADGGSVASWVREPRPWPLLLNMALELLDALSFVHAAGALHRDIKPANILLHGPHSRVWLADLGLAGSAGELVRGEGRTEGTPGYMAPEQAMGRVRELCPASDIYAVGVVLWQLVTSRRPFNRGHSGTAGGALPPLIPQPGLVIPAGLDQVLANCLATDPLARYDLAADVITELKALPEATVTASATPPTPRRGVPVAPGADASVSSLTLSTVSAPDEPFLLDLPPWNRPLPSEMPAAVPPALPPIPPGASVRLFTLRDPPLVGHKGLRQCIWDAAREVRESGQSQVVVVRGAPGSGKTHLLRSLSRTLAMGGWAEPLWLSYHRDPEPTDGYAGATKEWIRPWNETADALYARVLRRIGRSRGRMDAASRMESSDLVQWAVPTPDNPTASDAVALREVYRRLNALGWRGLAVLVLDGAHWSQEPADGLALAEAVMRSAASGTNQRSLVLATVDVDTDISELVAQGAKVVDMPVLEARGVRELIGAWLPLDPAVVRDVVDRCGGDAGLARDVVMAWADQDYLVARGPQLVLAPGVDREAALPSSRDSVLDARVGSLARQTQHPLAFVDRVHALSLVGRAVSPAKFDAVGGDLSTELDESGLFERGGEWVQFSSSRLYEAVRGRALARSDVGVLFEHLDDVSNSADELTDRGRWALGAGKRFEACEFLMAATVRHLEAGRLGQADSAAQQMLQATTGREPYLGARGQAWLLWGLSAKARAEYQAAEDRLRRAKRRLAAIDDEVGLAQVFTALGELAGDRGELDQASQHFAEAERICLSAGLARQRARVCLGRAELEIRRRNTDGAEVLYRRAEGIFAEVNDERGVAAAMLGQAEISLSVGLLADADEGFEEARRASERARDPVGAVRASIGRADVLRERGLSQAAERAYRRSIERADRLGATREALHARCGHAQVLDALGETSAALGEWRHIYTWAQGTGDFDPRVRALEAMIWMALDRRDLAGAYRHLSALGTVLATAPGHEAWSRYRLVGAMYMVGAGNGEGARGWLWEALELGLTDRTDSATLARLRTLVSRTEGRHPSLAELAEKALSSMAALSELDG
jgi:serine/threonine protein kinase/tetratricopeptide (TPR) repeat protein